MMRKSLLVLSLLTALVVTPALAQSPTGPTPRPGDVESIDAIITALYASISGPVGEDRDWDRLRSLFLPTARMIPVQRAQDGRVVYRTITVDEYIAGSGAQLVAMGFREHEVSRREDSFGYVAQVFSTYEGYRDGQEEPFLRGINTIQLINDGERWWVASIAWTPEQPGLTVPEQYMPGGDSR